MNLVQRIDTKGTDEDFFDKYDCLIMLTPFYPNIVPNYSMDLSSTIEYQITKSVEITNISTGFGVLFSDEDEFRSFAKMETFLESFTLKSFVSYLQERGGSI